jgi:hypothetical protein
MTFIPYSSILTADDIRIFPNPASSKASLVIKLSKDLDVKIDIIDISGRSLETVCNEKLFRGTNVLDMNLPELLNGIYICRISYAGGHVCKSVVISK